MGQFVLCVPSPSPKCARGAGSYRIVEMRVGNRITTTTTQSVDKMFCNEIKN